jgi:hypothetical protein
MSAPSLLRRTILTATTSRTTTTYTKLYRPIITTRFFAMASEVGGVHNLAK